MLKVRHSLYWQAGALGIAIALVFALSRFFPVIEFIDALQRRVMSLGAWAAVCYPLLFAACNILYSSFVCIESVHSPAMVSAKTLR